MIFDFVKKCIVSTSLMDYYSEDALIFFYKIFQVKVLKWRHFINYYNFLMKNLFIEKFTFFTTNFKIIFFLIKIFSFI